MFSGVPCLALLVSVAHSSRVTPPTLAGAPSIPRPRSVTRDLVLFQANAVKSTRSQSVSSSPHEDGTLEAQPPVSFSQRLRASAPYHMVQWLGMAGVIKVLCVMSNLVAQVSPFPQVRVWETRGDTGSADAAPYVSIAYGGCQWCLYGLFAYFVTRQSGFLILLQSNMLGALLGAYYAATFFRVCKCESSRASMCNYLSAAACLAIFQMFAIAVLPVQRALLLVGLISAFCSFAGALSVLVTTPLVIKAQNARSIAGPLVVANMFSALAWTICGIILGDRLITVPSATNFCACSFCVYLKLVYPSLEEEDAMPVCGTGETEDVPLMPRLLAHHVPHSYGAAVEPEKVNLGGATFGSVASQMSMSSELQVVDAGRKSLPEKCQAGKSLAEELAEEMSPAPATGGTF